MDADEHGLSLAPTLQQPRLALRYTCAVAQTYTAVIQYDAESGAYVGFIPALPGTHSCGESLEDIVGAARTVALPDEFQHAPADRGEAQPMFRAEPFRAV